MAEVICSRFASRARLGIGLLAAATLVVMTPVTAHADPARQRAPDKLASIRDYMDRGQALFVAKQYEQAAAVFERGFRAHPYSAFLYNAGVCHQKAGENKAALERFRHYLKVDPGAPDADKVRTRIAAIEALVAGPDAAKTSPARSLEAGVMKSLVVVETEPPGAPVSIYERADPNAGAFDPAGDNPGWKRVTSATAPASLTVDVGHYHVVVDKFRDFNASSTDVDVQPGHVHQIKLNLSQGEFMAFLRVAANVKHARIRLDDPRGKRPAWGAAPHGELVPAGAHRVHVEAPGFEPFDRSIRLSHGEHKELVAKLQRVSYGFLEIDGNVSHMTIAVDGEPIDSYVRGRSPVSAKLDAGRHRLRASADGYKSYSGMVEVPRGRVQPVHLVLVKKYPRGAAWTQAIIGGVVLGAGVYFGVESNRLHSELQADRNRGVLDQNDGRITRGRVYSIVADVGFGVAGVLGILATHNFIKDPTPDSGVHRGKLHEFSAAQSR